MWIIQTLPGTLDSLANQVLQCNSPEFKLGAILNSYVTNDSSIFAIELILGHALISSIRGEKKREK